MSYQSSEQTGGTAQGQSNTLGQQTSTNPSELDSNVPETAKDAPITGIEPGQNVPFNEQVQGQAKMFAGKVFGNDKEVQEGAARVRGLEESQQ
ncbi:hypothetical protein CBS101457_005182 [Exobasidium rhododendri]|nr:hypothetical protein CBS101457_005182 [Exobasidium rhododendri]